MARQVLENGVILPAEYSDDWYDDMTSNLTKLDDVIGSDSEKLSSADVGAAALSNNYNDLDNLPTIPTVNDATLTIQKNGVDVQTFTANASSNVTANITVPTKTSDLTNDSGFITSDNTKIPLAGSNQISGSLIPSTNGTVNLGSPSYQWNQAYIKSLTINGVACGDILTHNMSEFVDVTSAQTIGGQKIFTHGQTGVSRDLYHFATNPYAKNTPPANTSFQYIWFTGNSASQGLTNSWYGGYLEQLINTDGSARGRWLIRNTNENGMGIQLSQNADGSSSTIIPLFSKNIDLGTSTNKWKSFNGLTPSSLSLPSGNASDVIDISSYISALDGTSNSYTVPANGWVSIAVVGTAIDIVSSSWSDSRLRASSGNVRMLYPVLKNETLDISVMGTTLSYARFIPCQGNV